MCYVFKMRMLSTQSFEKPKIISEILLYQLRVPAATFWADECVDNQVKVNEEMEGESKMAMQFIRRF